MSWASKAAGSAGLVEAVPGGSRETPGVMKLGGKTCRASPNGHRKSAVMEARARYRRLFAYGGCARAILNALRDASEPKRGTWRRRCGCGSMPRWRSWASAGLLAEREDARLLARDHCVLAVQKLIDIMNNDKATHTAQIIAANSILDRGRCLHAA